LQTNELAVQDINLLIYAGDGVLNRGIRSPYLFAVYGELSHEVSLVKPATAASFKSQDCGEPAPGGSC
jgi:hypothetical protein